MIRLCVATLHYIRFGEQEYHLIVHCALYILPFYICFGFTWRLAVLFITHIVIDALKARYGRINYIADQVMHYEWLFIFLG